VGILGFGCDVSGDSDDFKVKNRVTVYPGKNNNWLVIKTSESSGTIEDFIEKYIVDPLDTSWLNDNVVATNLLIPPGQERVSLQATGLRLQDTANGNPKTAFTLTTPVKPAEGKLEFYLVSFVPPRDAPASLPWPVEGCVEKAGWYLSAPTSDIFVATGKSSGYMVAEKADAPMDPLKTLKWAGFGVVGVVGLVYLTPALVRALMAVRSARRA
jgi:hypothetical protein